MVTRQFWRSLRALLSSPAIWSRTPSWLPPIPARRATSVFVWRAVSPTVAGLAVWFMAAAVVGAALVDGRTWRIRWPRPDKTALLELSAIVTVVAVAVWLRIPDLANVPPNVHGDEADVGLLAREILAGRMPVLLATAPA